MRTVGISKAKQRLSELIERAKEGERNGITKRGKLAAMIVPARTEANLREVFEEIEQVRKRARARKGVSAKKLIVEGRV
ncbi:MAG: type II toxin-antitoxin system prevent-host-death family antitoxin [Candidatus Acidiferrales bacterium]